MYRTDKPTKEMIKALHKAMEKYLCVEIDPLFAEAALYSMYVGVPIEEKHRHHEQARTVRLYQD